MTLLALLVLGCSQTPPPATDIRRVLTEGYYEASVTEFGLTADAQVVSSREVLRTDTMDEGWHLDSLGYDGLWIASHSTKSHDDTFHDDKMLLYSDSRSTPLKPLAGFFLGWVQSRPVYLSSGRVVMWQDHEWMSIGRKTTGKPRAIIEMSSDRYLTVLEDERGRSHLWIGALGKYETQVSLVDGRLSVRATSTLPQVVIVRRRAYLVFRNSRSHGSILSVDLDNTMVRTIYEGGGIGGVTSCEDSVFASVYVEGDVKKPKCNIIRITVSRAPLTIMCLPFEFFLLCSLSKDVLLGIKVYPHGGCALITVNLSNGRIGAVTEFIGDAVVL